MKKIIIPFIFIAILIALTNPLSAQAEDEKCEKLKEEIQTLIDECQTCKTDEECFVDEKSKIWCPFGCYLIRSHAYDNSKQATLLEEKLKKYWDECGMCIYDCLCKPQKYEVGCRKGICVDLRSYRSKEENE